MRAQKAGYDGVQLHACHSYLINDFASALNKREDEYGGSAVNRARFGCEVIRAIRASCGEDFIISARVSGCDPTVEDAVIAADEYVKAGCDYLQVSSGIAPLDSLEHDESLPYNKTASLGVRLRAALKPPVPVSLVNGIRTPEQVEYLLSNDLIDTVDLACGLLADPAFTEAILYGAPYHKCLSCRGCGFGLHRGHPLRRALPQVPELPGLRLRPHPQPPLPRHGGQRRRRIPLPGAAGKETVRGVFP